MIVWLYARVFAELVRFIVSLDACGVLEFLLVRVF